MSMFEEEILENIKKIYESGKLSPHESAVLEVLLNAHEEGRKVTQRDICLSRPWLGCHPEHEVDVVPNKLDTTTRQVRHIIRKLRINHLVPIIGGHLGYYFPRSYTHAQDYVLYLERRARAQAEAHYETYLALRESVDVKSEFFENIY